MVLGVKANRGKNYPKKREPAPWAGGNNLESMGPGLKGSMRNRQYVDRTGKGNRKATPDEIVKQIMDSMDKVMKQHSRAKKSRGHP